MTSLLDSLIMLLSTDWFKPHWSAIGISVDEPERSLLQEGCRKIVGQILSGATEYYLVSFSDERREETRAMFESLAKASEAEEAAMETMEEWSGISDEDLKAGWLFDGLTEDLLSDDAKWDGPLLGSDLRRIVAVARESQDSRKIDFEKLSTSSKSSWDRQINQLRPSQPTALSDILSTFFKAQRFKAFWTSVRGKLTPEQREELTAWYRAAAKFRAKRDMAPSYFGNGIF